MEGLSPRCGRGPRGMPGYRSARSLALVTALGAMMAACSGSDGDDGIDSQPVIEVGPSGVGTCLAFGDDVTDEVTELPEVPCDADHTHEIFAIIENSGEVYPGYDALEEVATVACLGEFEGYVGVGQFDSTLFSSWLVPTLTSWNDEDDRETICVVGNGNGEPLTESVQNSRR